MKRLNIKKKKFANYKKNGNSTPLNKSKDYYFIEEKSNEQIWINPQKKFKNVCIEFKGNYFEEVLKNPRIFLQYVDISNSDDEITRTLSFKKKAFRNELNKDKFTKDEKLYESKYKKTKKL